MVQVEVNWAWVHTLRLSHEEHHVVDGSGWLSLYLRMICLAGAACERVLHTCVALVASYATHPSPALLKLVPPANQGRIRNSQLLMASLQDQWMRQALSVGWRGM